jgi:putative endonuclease
VHLNLSQKKRAYLKGHWGEWIAAFYLRLKGYKVLANRFQTPLGEIDLLVRKGKTVVAVEVKSRKTIEEAAWALTRFQQRRIERALLYYLARKPPPHHYRFDVVLVAPWKWPHHIPGAWSSSY